MLYDMHVHSTSSDGTLSPEELLIRLCPWVCQVLL